MTHKRNQKSIHLYERASAGSSRGSVTVEAALALPIFFYAALCLVFLLEIMAIGTSVKSGVHSAAKEAAKEFYGIQTVNFLKIQSDVVQAIGRKRLDRSIVEGGSAGIQCYKSYADVSRAELYIVAEYKVKIPFLQFGIPPMRYKETVKVKAWTGYEGGGFGQGDGQIVYITDHGAVYHQDYRCTYLQLSIEMVSAGSLSELRNDSGGKYHACEKCVYGGAMGGVYITGSGNKYHNSIGCSGLKRTIYAVSLSEVTGKGGCSRCSR